MFKIVRKNEFMKTVKQKRKIVSDRENIVLIILKYSIRI